MTLSPPHHGWLAASASAADQPRVHPSRRALAAKLGEATRRPRPLRTETRPPSNPEKFQKGGFELTPGKRLTRSKPTPYCSLSLCLPQRGNYANVQVCEIPSVDSTAIQAPIRRPNGSRRTANTANTKHGPGGLGRVARRLLCAAAPALYHGREPVYIYIYIYMQPLPRGGCHQLATPELASSGPVSPPVWYPPHGISPPTPPLVVPWG